MLDDEPMQIRSLNNFDVVVLVEVVVDEVIGEIVDVELDGEVNEGR
jgi:hypothetical protein